MGYRGSTSRTACVEVDVDFDLDDFDEQDMDDDFDTVERDESAFPKTTTSCSDGTG